MTNEFIKTCIHKSQHCNRNWDLTKNIPQEDINLIVESATQCPSKQNLNFYKTHVITNRDIIEKIHDHTKGFIINDDFYTNSQTIANVLLVFTEDHPKIKRDLIRKFNKETGKWNAVKVDVELDSSNTNIDRFMALGVAAGYVSLVSTILGYHTGLCRCFDENALKNILNGEKTLLIIGIGYPDDARNRLEHHQNANIVYPSLINQREVVFHS